MKRQTFLELAGLLALTAAALAVRLIYLRDIPFGLHNDEAANGLDALAVLDGRHAIFFPSNFGREPLFVYLQAAALALFGISPYALRLPAAVVGALTVPAVYWMSKEAFRRVRPDAAVIAFWTAAFVAFSYWHLAFSRVGYRGILVPLLLSLSLAFFWRARNQHDEGHTTPWFSLILCGVFLGAVQYTYIAARIAPALIVLLIATDMVQHGFARPRVRQGLISLAVIAAAALFIFLPLGMHLAGQPDALGGRIDSISVLNPELNHGNPARALLVSARNFVGMFLLEADLNARHNPAVRPVLGIVLSLFALIGVMLCLRRARDLAYLFPLYWAALFALPSLLTLQGSPHSLRAIGMIPAVFLLVALGILWAAAGAARLFRIADQRKTVLIALLPLPIFLWSAYATINDYFGAWERNERLPFAFHQVYLELTREMDALGGEDKAWIVPMAQELFQPGDTNYTMDFAFDAMGESGGGHAVIVSEPFSAAEQVAALAASYPYLNLIDWPERQIPVEGAFLQADEKGFFDFLLETYGEVVGEFRLSNAGYTQYQIDQNADITFAPDMQPVDVLFDDSVRLTGVALGGTYDELGPAGDQVRAGGEAWIVLRWETARDIDRPLKAGLRLLSPSGYDAGRGDELLVGNGYPFFTVWPAGETTYSYHILPTRAAIPPDEYSLAVTVYEENGGRILSGKRGEESTLAPIPVATMPVVSAGRPASIEPDVGFDNMVDGVAGRERFVAGGMNLVGYDLPFNETAPGVRLPLTLYWQKAAANGATDFEIRLIGPAGVSVQEARTIAHAEQVQTGEILRDWQDIRIPMDAENGSYALLLRHPDGSEFVLAELVIEGRPRAFDLPSLARESDGHFGDLALLRGLELPLPGTLAAGSVLEVPLVWEARRDGDQALVRFVHVLNEDGQLVAQQDSVPCADACPTESWLTGEILRDVARLDLPANLPSGSYAVVVGFYDPSTGQRLPARDGQGTDLEHDIYFLPGRIDVTSR